MVEDYLSIIWKAQELPGVSVSTNEIAATQDVTPSSVSANLKKLARDGLIEYQPYGHIRLTPAGNEVAVAVVRRHRVIETYLVEYLGFGWDEVHVEADALEHAVSDRVVDRMHEVLGRPDHDPHGHPIPRADGTIEKSRGRDSASRLSDMEQSATGHVARISDQEPAILRYLEERQIVFGSRIRLEENNAVAGSVSVMRLGPEGEPVGLVEVAVGAASAVWVEFDPHRP